MARGWESKAVEAQQAEASESRPVARPPLSPAEKLKLQKREGLLLDRKRVLQQLEQAGSERYRTMLQQALAQLDRKIADVD
jgi:hypothetical protein